LTELIDNKEIRGVDLAYELVGNFHKLPNETREKLVLKLEEDQSLLEDPNTPWMIAQAIASHFSNMSPLVQQLLFKLADEEESAGDVATTVSNNYDNLPPDIVVQLFIKLADKDKTAEWVSGQLVENFDKIQSNTLGQLLLKLAENNKTFQDVARIILSHSDKIQSNTLGQLLLKLAENKYAGSPIMGLGSSFVINMANAIVRNFDKLSASIRDQLLLKLVDNRVLARAVSFNIKDDRNNVPDNVRKQILAKLEKKVIS
jgi:hypothetical protein